MKINFKVGLLALPFLFIISCSDPNDPQEPKIAWDATNYTMYNEFMQCSVGEEYNQEALDNMVESWRDLGLSESLLGSWGYESVSPNESSFNNYWELSWSSKEAADAAWEGWLADEDAAAWLEQSSKVLQCDGENRDGYDFIFPYDPYAFGDTPGDGSFAASFSPCTLNEGMGEQELSNALIKYNSWLDNIDQSQVSGFYAYGIYFPDDASSTEDFWFVNFHKNLETMNEGNELWEAIGGDAKVELETVTTCGDPEISNGQVFYDPTDPDFS